MRSLALLAFLLPTLAAPPAALAFDLDLDLAPMQQAMSAQLQQRLEQTVLPAIAGRIERRLERATLPPARGDAGTGPARSAAISASGDAEGRPARMSCRPAVETALECVVVTRWPGLERVAQAP